MIKCQFYDIYLLKRRTNERYDNIDKNDFNLGGLYGA
ncbi:hypothetical protein [Staphylococcus aureus]|nr:hypothetical protein [Staphylococcus aureus]PZI00805.1 hypothetical protein C7Q96_10895 [Staphylococcus aureus]